MEPFIPLNKSLLKDFKLVKAAVLCAIWNFSQMEDKCCNASYQTIGDAIGLERTRVSRAIKSLISDKHVIDQSPGRVKAPHDLIVSVAIRNRIEGVSVADSNSQQEASVANSNSSDSHNTTSVANSDKSVANSTQRDSIRDITTNTTTKDNGDKKTPPKSKRKKSPKPKKEVDPLKKPMMDALTRMCNIDYRTADKTQLGQIGTAATNLIKVVTHVENFERNFMQWWESCDWRGQKGQAPTPAQVRREFGNFEKWITSGQPLGSSKNGNHSQNSTTGTSERKRSTLDDKPTFNPHTGETVSGVRRSGISTPRPTPK